MKINYYRVKINEVLRGCGMVNKIVGSGPYCGNWDFEDIQDQVDCKPVSAIIHGGLSLAGRCVDIGLQSATWVGRDVLGNTAAKVLLAVAYPFVKLNRFFNSGEINSNSFFCMPLLYNTIAQLHGLSSDSKSIYDGLVDCEKIPPVISALFMRILNLMDKNTFFGHQQMEITNSSIKKLQESKELKMVHKGSTGYFTGHIMALRRQKWTSKTLQGFTHLGLAVTQSAARFVDLVMVGPAFLGLGCIIAGNGARDGIDWLMKGENDYKQKDTYAKCIINGYDVANDLKSLVATGGTGPVEILVDVGTIVYDIGAVTCGILSDIAFLGMFTLFGADSKSITVNP